MASSMPLGVSCVSTIDSTADDSIDSSDVSSTMAGSGTSSGADSNSLVELLFDKFSTFESGNGAWLSKVAEVAEMARDSLYATAFWRVSASTPTAYDSACLLVA